MKTSITLMMSRLVLVALICALPMLASAFGEEHPYAFTGSEKVSDLDMLLAQKFKIVS